MTRARDTALATTSGSPDIDPLVSMQRIIGPRPSIVSRSTVCASSFVRFSNRTPDFSKHIRRPSMNFWSKSVSRSGSPQAASSDGTTSSMLRPRVIPAISSLTDVSIFGTSYSTVVTISSRSFRFSAAMRRPSRSQRRFSSWLPSILRSHERRVAASCLTSSPGPSPQPKPDLPNIAIPDSSFLIHLSRSTYSA